MTKIKDLVYQTPTKQFSAEILLSFKECLRIKKNRMNNIKTCSDHEDTLIFSSVTSLISEVSLFFDNDT